MNNSTYKHLIVNWGGHIAHAASAIELARLAECLFGKLSTSLGYHPFKCDIRASEFAKNQAYKNSYYWQQYVSLPQFGEIHDSGHAFWLQTKIRAGLTTLRIVVRASLCFIRTFDKRQALLCVRKHQLRDLEVGAQIISDYLRISNKSRGFTELNTALVKTIFQCHELIHYWLDVHPNMNFREVLFNNPETTYRQELARRALLKRGATEIYHDIWADGEISLSRSHKRGVDLLLSRPKELSVTQIEAARRHLDERVNGRLTLSYLANDVDQRPVRTPQALEIEDKNRKPAAVLFLHAVSDAQHYFEDDIFIDLHDWFEESLRILRNNNFRIYVKGHPAMYSPLNAALYPSDLRYISYLCNRRGLNLDLHDTNETASTLNNSDIVVVHHKISIKTLKNSIGPFVAITNHGSIAKEATFLRIPTIWSHANPSRNFPEFAFAYQSTDQYERLVGLYSDGKLVVDNERLNNCISFVATEMNNYNDEYYAVMSRCAGKNINSHFEDFESMLLSVDPIQTPELHQQLQNFYARSTGRSCELKTV